jgi:hypothetical protein
MAPRLQCLPPAYQPRRAGPERVCSPVPTGPQPEPILAMSEGNKGAGSEPLPLRRIGAMIGGWRSKQNKCPLADLWTLSAEASAVFRSVGGCIAAALRVAADYGCLPGLNRQPRPEQSKDRISDAPGTCVSATSGRDFAVGKGAVAAGRSADGIVPMFAE